MTNKFAIKDEDNLEELPSGLKRSNDAGKPDFTLTYSTKLPYDEQMHYRFAQHMTKAAKAKGARNWEKSCTQEDLDRFKAGLMRHVIQYMLGMEDEDHAAAIMFALMGIEHIKYLMNQPKGLVGTVYGVKIAHENNVGDEREHNLEDWQKCWCNQAYFEKHPDQLEMDFDDKQPLEPVCHLGHENCEWL